LRRRPVAREAVFGTCRKASQLERLDDLLRQDPQRAEIEILKHLDGDLVIKPRLPTASEQRAEIIGRAKSDSF
jgi:hypothetical protein